MELFLIVIVAVLFLATFFFFSEASIPISTLTLNVVDSLSPSNQPVIKSLHGISNTLALKVSFPIYVIAIFGFFGWWFFVIYAGVGLTALPLDLILEYKGRPKRMKKEEFTKARDDLVKELAGLRKMGDDIKENNEIAKRTKGCTYNHH